MKVRRKIRPESVLKTLPEKKQQEIIEYLEQKLQTIRES
jgi:hypothetical protein